MAITVLLILAAMWAAVLLPPILRARTVQRSGDTIGDFRYRLGVLGNRTGRRQAATARAARPSPEAKELGLIGHVVPDGGALAKAREIADQIAANGPLAVQAILRTMRMSEGKHEDDCWADDARIGAAVFSSADAKEGPRAFLEKRAPRFEGR